MQNAGVELSADDGPEAAVLVGEIVIEGFSGDAQLVTQVGNTDGRIGPLQKIVKQGLFNLPLAAVGSGRTGELRMVHFILQFTVKV